VGPLALTMGDPAGVGPEITAKAWAHSVKTKGHPFIAIGDVNVFSRAFKAAGLPPPKAVESAAQASQHFTSSLPVLHIGSVNDLVYGQPDPAHAEIITGAIQTAVTLSLKGETSGIVTCPISKENLYAAGFKYPGHTEYLGHLCEGHDAPYPRGPVMLLEGGGLRCALVTIHMPLSEAVNGVSPEAITHTAQTLYGALKIDYGIAAPHIAMAGLNPHAGENGALGDTEIQIQNPTAAKLREMGVNISGARSADTLFHAEARKGYDAVLAMYHDQGLIPVKTLDFHGGVNITLGLPVIRTSPDHGTAFDIAGQGLARADSLIAALDKAAMLSRNRAQYAR